LDKGGIRRARRPNIWSQNLSGCPSVTEFRREEHILWIHRHVTFPQS
jgi:hypothetical protein